MIFIIKLENNNFNYSIYFFYNYTIVIYKNIYKNNIKLMIICDIVIIIIQLYFIIYKFSM